MRMLLVVLSLILLPFSALAETFTIENGSAFLRNFGTLALDVSGANFRLLGADLSGVTHPIGVAGQPYTADGRASVGDGAVFTLNGVRFTGNSFLGADARLMGTTEIPSNFVNGTLSGTASLFATVRTIDPATSLLTTHTLNGSGNATFQFVNGLTMSRVDVAFEPSSPIGNTVAPLGGIIAGPSLTNGGGVPATVPEPGTWLLLASGLGVIGLYRRAHGH